MAALAPLAMNWMSALRTRLALFVSAEHCGPEVNRMRLGPQLPGEVPLSLSLCIPMSEIGHTLPDACPVC